MMNRNRFTIVLIVGICLTSFALCWSVTGESRDSADTVVSATQTETKEIEDERPPWERDRDRRNRGFRRPGSGLEGRELVPRGPGGPGGRGGPGGPGFGPDMMRQRWFESPENIEAFREENPELAETIERSKEVNFEILKLVKDFHDKKEKDDSTLDRKMVETDLQALLDEAIELEITRQKMLIETTEKKLELLKRLLERRIKTRDREVDHRMKTLLDKPFPANIERRHPFFRRPPSDRRRDDRRGGQKER